MAMAAIRGGAVRRSPYLTVVEDGTGPLAERRAAAVAAAAGPQARVSGLEADIAGAVERGDYTKAGELQPLLIEAKEVLAVASLELRLLDESRAEIERARQDAQREVQEAEYRDRAQRMLDAAEGARQDALDATNAALSVMRSNLLAAQAAYQEARRAEEGVLAATRQEYEARRQLGQYGRDPGPVAVGSNQCQALANTDPLVRELAKWRP
jgi:hypothetical protein